jgi:DNA-binding beta-propeller fold protein YncE
VRSWPTFVLIGPDGRVIGQTSGEGNYDVLDQAITQSIEDSRPKGILNETPLKLALERAKVPVTPLWYPGKIAVNAGGEVAVSDSNHNRIVFSDANGKVKAIAGSGEAGFKDGDLSKAQFNNPLGLAYDAEKSLWYVADTNNHAIRAVSSNEHKVWTIAGTGQQAEWGATGGTGTQAALSSPWDVYLHQRTLYIAMAGPHQIWQIDLKTGQVSVFAGSGVEARKDGTRQTAAFAQPSGLASDGEHLFVADSESSSIRAIDLPGFGDKVTTLAGGDLFDFGDKDGQGLNVRLQHPLGLTYHDGALYLADTYNSKIKRLDPKTAEVKTVYSGGLYEPGGLAFNDGSLLIADTNNNAVRRVNLKDRKLATFTFAGLKPPAAAVEAAAPAKAPAASAAKQALAPNGRGELVFGLGLPEGFTLNYDAPLKFEAKIHGSGLRLAKSTVSGKVFTLPLHIPIATEGGGSGRVELTAFVSYCSHGKGGVCRVEKVTRSVPFEVKAGGGGTLKVDGGELP